MRSTSGGGTTTNQYTPVKAHLPGGVPITRVSDLYYGVDALTSTGKLYAWGYNQYGDVGNNSTASMVVLPTPVTIAHGLVVTGVSGYGDSSLAEVTSVVPTVASVSPTSGRSAGGTSVTITGSHLTGA